VVDLNELLAKLVELNGSDLHLTVGMPPVMRINGLLVPTDNPRLTPRDTKEMVYAILRQEQREKLEREWEFDFAYALPGVARFRVNGYFQRDSLGAAFRHIPVGIKPFDELGLPKILPELCKKPRGFVLVTGPTGSGKSTTLASMLDYVNSTQELHIITIEDPIEYLHQHRKSVINQREVGADTHSFSSALKYILRQDPDVIMIGEMRDLETVAAALTAAETGHLVFATLHTQDAAQTIDRVIDVFPPYQQQQVRIQLAGTLQGIVSQQLLPTADGASRIVACEVLIPTSGIRNMIREGKTHQLMSAMQAGQQYGMVTMDQSLADLHKRGLVTLDYALQRAIDPNVLRALLGHAP
jgi:twitching motility protein PilT